MRTSNTEYYTRYKLTKNAETHKYQSPVCSGRKVRRKAEGLM